VPPPIGAAPPAPKSVSNDGTFDFARFGVRVPAIIVSSYVRPGTVFRAPPGSAPFDHTSVLATLRDWLNLDADPNNPFLPSPRIQSAPTLDCVLTFDDTNKNTNWPNITANCTIGDDDKSLGIPLNGLQKSLIAAAVRQKSGTPNDPDVAAQATQQAKALKTYADAIKFMHPDAP
jgi:phospholipase C